MKTALCFLVAVLFVIQVRAQQSFNDSMLQVFRSEKVEANKLKMIYSLYGEGNAAVAKQILLRELKESKKEDTFRVFLCYMHCQ